MPHLIALLLFPVTLVVAPSYLIFMIVDGPGRGLLDLGSAVLDITLFLLFVVTLVNAWLKLIFSVPLRDDGRFTLIGKGLLLGIVCWSWIAVTLWQTGQIIASVMTGSGVLALLLGILPAGPERWDRHILAGGVATLAISLVALLNPFTWALIAGNSQPPAIPASYHGVYQPDYDRETGEAFVEHYQAYQKRTDNTPTIRIYQDSLFMINTLGRPMSNTHAVCQVEPTLLFRRGGDERCRSAPDSREGRYLEIIPEGEGRFRCANCRDFGKPAQWERVAPP